MPLHRKARDGEESPLSLRGKAREGEESPNALRASYQPSRFRWTITSVCSAPTKWCSTRSYSTVCSDRCRCCCSSAQGSGAARPASERRPTPVKKQQTARSRSSLAHGSSQCRDARPATADARSRMCGKKCKETWEGRHSQWGSLQAVSKLLKNWCDGCMFIKMHTFAQKSSFLTTVNTAPLAPPQSGTEPLPTRVIATQHSPAHPTTQAAKAAMSVPERVGNYSRISRGYSA